MTMMVELQRERQEPKKKGTLVKNSEMKYAK